ncbi:MAG: U32 family peptidase, partial [Oscillospiraceae bacterium]|nr:U32 family peptidase [Oscillospiraceae bacterium]
MIELLAPAGSMEALRAAVQNGADAVYLGSGAFNARMGARNFTPDELQEAVTYCHIRGAQVHLTLNTLALDRELPKVAETIRMAARRGVDAFIVQDLGTVTLCREIAPHIPVHASTQMSIHSLDGVKQAAALGASRVVLSRELPKEDIEYICRRSPVEIEVFGHGALCMCYSGQCYFSGVIGQRSGNRGQCAQPCRLPYGYGRFEERYPLSLKDSCLISHVRELDRMGVASLKLEGRMKRPEYVAVVTRIYRSVLDGNPLTKKDEQELTAIFSRQGFTQGYYLGKTGSAMFGVRQEGREDHALHAAARATYESGERPRVPVRFYAMIRKGEPAQLAADDGCGNTCKTTGAMPETALTRPLTEADLAQRLQKTGGTPYYMESFRGLIDPGLTLSAAAVNAMRRDVLAQLSAVRSRQSSAPLGEPSTIRAFAGETEAPKLTVSVRKAEQITAKLLDANPAVLYVPLCEVVEHRIAASAMPNGTELCAVLPRVIRDSELPRVTEQLKTAKTLGISSVLIGNLGQIAPARELGFSIRGDFGLNLFNSASMNTARELGFASAVC